MHDYKSKESCKAARIGKYAPQTFKSICTIDFFKIKIKMLLSHKFVDVFNSFEFVTRTRTGFAHETER